MAALLATITRIGREYLFRKLSGTSAQFAACSRRGEHTENAMRKVALATATVLALGLTAGAAQADKVIIKKGHHFDRGRHFGLVEHRDEGWRRAHAEGTKVIIKKHRHFD
jgi:hypothetical protein